jgi:hypothetical protein
MCKKITVNFWKRIFGRECSFEPDNSGMNDTNYEEKKAAFLSCFTEDHGRWRVGNHWLDEAFSEFDAERAAEILSETTSSMGDIYMNISSLYVQSGFLILHNYSSGEVVFLNSGVKAEDRTITRRSFTAQIRTELFVRERYVDHEE